MKWYTKYGIFLIGALSLIMLSALALPNSQDSTKLSNNVDEPVTINMGNSILKCTHQDLSSNSDVIVIGTVNETFPSRWNTIDGKQPNKPLTELIPGIDMIYTDISISVDKYIKNPLSSKEIIVRTVGGTVGKVTINSEDEPNFEPGEKVLLYLSKDTSPYTANVGPEHFFVYGSMQGKFKLTNDGKATTPDESTTLDELLSTIKK